MKCISSHMKPFGIHVKRTFFFNTTNIRMWIEGICQNMRMGNGVKREKAHKISENQRVQNNTQKHSQIKHDEFFSISYEGRKSALRVGIERKNTKNKKIFQPPTNTFTHWWVLWNRQDAHSTHLRISVFLCYSCRHKV